MIMTHSDDKGLVLPPRVAPKQVRGNGWRRRRWRGKVVPACHAKQQQRASCGRAAGHPVVAVLCIFDARCTAALGWPEGLAGAELPLPS
jgi:hypothetical protein